MGSCNTFNRLFPKTTKEKILKKLKKRIWFSSTSNWGRGVLHDKELTYSVIVPESHPNMPSTITEAYRVISQGLLEGFKI